jgi:hypothetical protein
MRGSSITDNREYESAIFGSRAGGATLAKEGYMQTMLKVFSVILIAATIASCGAGLKKENARLKEQVRQLQEIVSQLKRENEELKAKIQTQQQQASTIGAWSGADNKETEPFTIKKSPWTVAWTTEPTHPTNYFQVYLHRADGELEELLIDTTKKANQTLHLHKVGSFYLSIRAAKTSWTIKVLAPE